MGLCKCPKRKVTNLFCFEHRVNVCEHCLVANHPKCIVQSYLQWLQDSDYNPVCSLCNTALDNEVGDKVVRLVCYDVFHWNCLNAYAQQLPANTAPAGYTCPTCNIGIFPGQNLVSPVADALKTQLTEVNWARAGLGMPLIEEPEISEPAPATLSTEEIPMPNQNGPQTVLENHVNKQKQTQNNVNKEQNNSTKLPTHENYYNQFQHLQHSQQNSTTHQQTRIPNYSHASNYASTPVGKTTQSILSVDDAAPYSRVEKPAPRRLFDTTQQDTTLNMSHDHDEDKYKRRPALYWLSKWFKSRTDPRQKKDPSANFKRFLMVLVLGLIGFITILIIFSQLGRRATDDDPFLDPMANPNIHVN